MPANDARLLPVWVTGVAAVLLFAGIAWALADVRGSTALQFAATPKSFATIVHAWPHEHLELYRAHLWWDALLIADYAVFGVLLATRTRIFASLPAALARRMPGWLPLAAAFDGAENLLHAWLTAAPRFGAGWAYLLATGCASLKWALLCGFGLLVVYALAAAER